MTEPQIQQSWRDVPLVFIPIPTCPHCGATGFITVRCEAAGDGSRSRKSICKSCSGRSIIVFELPEENIHGLPSDGNRKN